MNDLARKPFHTMLVELIRLWLRDHAKPVHYYTGSLYRRDFDNKIYAYVGAHNLSSLRDRIDDPFWASVLDNKILFDLFFREMNIRLPTLVGYDIGSQLISGNDIM